LSKKLNKIKKKLLFEILINYCIKIYQKYYKFKYCLLINYDIISKSTKL